MALDPSLYEGLAGIRYALRQFLAYSEAATGAEGVTSQQYQVMLVIKSHDGGAITIGDLADQMLLQHHGAVQLVDRLVKLGLVERQHSTADRRVVLVVLTAEGEERLERLATSHLRELLKHEKLLAESLRRLGNVSRQFLD